MNGDRTPQQYAEAAEESAQRTALRARDIADAALRMEQMAGRMERSVDEVTRRLRNLESKVAVGFANMKSATDTPRQQLASFSETEWEDSPTGTHKIKKVRRGEWESWQKERELTADAKRWRKALRTSGKVALAIVLVIAGALVRHVIGGFLK